MWQSRADILVLVVPVLATLAFNLSFLAPLSQSQRLPGVLRSLFACPLCLCTHLAWFWALVAFPEPFLRFWTLGYILTCGLLAYVLHHVIEIFVLGTRILGLIETHKMKELTKEEDNT